MHTLCVFIFMFTMSNCMKNIIIINTHHHQYHHNVVLVIMIIMAIIRSHFG